MKVLKGGEEQKKIREEEKKKKEWDDFNEAIGLSHLIKTISESVSPFSKHFTAFFSHYVSLLCLVQEQTN